MKTLPTSDAEPKSPFSRPLLTEAQAAERLQISQSCLAKWRCVGDGPPFVKLGRAVRYDIADLVSFAEQAKRRSTSDSGAA